MNILDRFTDKRILIWGYGREGKTTEKFLLTHTKPLEVQHFEGPFSDLPAEGFDIVFKSPGIVMEEEDPKFTSMTELFLELFADRTIGVTGTKGKSTTSSLLYHCLSRCLDRKVILLGNIGLPCLDYYDEIDEDTVVVFELSCHQLAHTKVSPHIAVFLNLFEEHLDYYGTVEKYFKAKTNITTHQTEKDFFFVGENVPKIPTLASITRID
ncbi:MAG: UDP-N-acetylmuramoyl-L-alanine--D-glutamate ligase, partial [Lachnospiraceae bacterium]|nr:UDP-N-acetylmuramoyl-L-alanine--D-glutamate ligase [Lachnospiraceae bacterium]